MAEQDFNNGRAEMRTFSYDNKKRERYSQTFTKEKVIMKGQEICLYDLIQNSNVDTEIYPTLLKYGCLDHLKLDTDKVYGDFTAIKGLRDAIEIAEKGNELFNKLPAEVKQEFNNNPKEFMEKGENWLKAKIEETNKPAETTPEVKGGNTNE